MRKLLLTTIATGALIGAAFFLRPHVSVAQSGGPPPGLTPPGLISQVAVTRGSTQAAQVIQAVGARLHLNARETATVAIQLAPGHGPVLLRTPEGGHINGHRKVQFDTTAQQRQITFTFDPGDYTGRFFIEAQDQRSSETVAEFWVGPQAPLGQAGPALSFN